MEIQKSNHQWQQIAICMIIKVFSLLHRRKI